jgi:hypothetical protein
MQWSTACSGGGGWGHLLQDCVRDWCKAHVIKAKLTHGDEFRVEVKRCAFLTSTLNLAALSSLRTAGE